MLHICHCNRLQLIFSVNMINFRITDLREPSRNTLNEKLSVSDSSDVTLKGQIITNADMRPKSQQIMQDLRCIIHNGRGNIVAACISEHGTVQHSS